MNYFEWIGDLNAIKIHFPERSFRDYWMVEGNPVIGWDENLTATYSCNNSPDFDFGLADNGWPVFSQRMRSVIEQYSSQLVQFLPFRLVYGINSKNASGYFVGQILKLVDCLDRVNTKVRNTWLPINEWGDYGTIHPIVIDNSKIKDVPIFRIYGKCITIVVREDIINLLKSLGINPRRHDIIDSTARVP